MVPVLTGVDSIGGLSSNGSSSLERQIEAGRLARKLADLGGERRYDLLLMFQRQHHIPSKNRLNLSARWEAF